MSQSWVVRNFSESEESLLSQAGQTPLMARLMAQRSIPVSQVKDFVGATWDCLSPVSPPGLHDASRTITRVALECGSAAVMGDYDVDGVTSCTMLKMLMDDLNIPCHIFLPHRIDHGYGVNDVSLEAMISECGDPTPELLIIADSGSSSETHIQRAKQAGFKYVVVIDHHIIEEENKSVSADALVNWRIGTGDELCTAGLVLLLARQLSMSGHEEVDWLKLAPYAAVGTVADVMPIWGDNRVIVKQGLKMIKDSPKIGLPSLVAACKIELGNVTQEDIAYRVGPCLNASGRVDVCRRSYDLLMENDPGKAAEMADDLRNTNLERRSVQKDIKKKCLELIGDTPVEDGLLLIDPSWHSGVVGIVASDMCRKYSVPALIMGSVNGVIKGSARSVPGISVKKIMDLCSEMFEKYGGHDAAAGATLKTEYIDRAPEMFKTACRKYYEEYGRPVIDRMYDADLRPTTVTVDTCKEVVDVFHPYCQHNNPEPRFKLSGVLVSNFTVKKGDDWRLSSFEGSCDGVDLPMKFKSFSDKLNSSLEWQTVDVIFCFPQKLNYKWGTDLSVVSVITRDE